jgi:hypothetical protein
MLGSEEFTEPFQTVCRTYNHKTPDVRILGEDGDRSGSASLIIVTYEGEGIFSIRSTKGSKIALRGDKAHKTFALE